MKCVCFYNPNTILHSLVFQAYICLAAQRCGNIVTSYQNVQFYGVCNQKPTSTTNDDQLLWQLFVIFSYYKDTERHFKLSVARRFGISPIQLGNIVQPVSKNGSLSPPIFICLLRSHLGSRGTRMVLRLHSNKSVLTTLLAKFHRKMNYSKDYHGWIQTHFVIYLY